MASVANLEQDESRASQAALVDCLRGAAAIGGYLGLSPRTTQRLIAAGDIPAFQVGGVSFAVPRVLDAWLAELIDVALRRSFAGGSSDG